MAGGRRIVCELSPSMDAGPRILDAIAGCEEHDAELYVVWVPPVGGFRLPAALETAVELASARGIPATSAVRFGSREVVLREVTATSAARRSAARTAVIAGARR